jgi:hypothetical protein
MDPHRLTLIYDDSTQPILIKFNQLRPNLGRRRFGEPYPKAARTGAHKHDTTEPPAWFYYFLGFLRIFLYRKSQGLGLWITRPRLSLSPWWTHDTGAAWPLRGSGGCRDSLEREREGYEVVGVFTNGATWRWSYGDDHMTVLHRCGWWCSD